MHKHTLYFTNDRSPSFLGLGFSSLEAAEDYVRYYYQFDPTPPSGILSAVATPYQVAIISRAETRGREYDVIYLPPIHADVPAHVRVRTYPIEAPVTQPIGRIIHYPDGSRVLYYSDGTYKTLAPLPDETSW